MPSPDTTPSSGSPATHWVSALIGLALMGTSLVLARHDTAATTPPPPAPQTVLTQAATQPSNPASMMVQIPALSAGITTPGADGTPGAAAPSGKLLVLQEGVTTTTQTPAPAPDKDYVSPATGSQLYWRTEGGKSTASIYLKVSLTRTPKIDAAALAATAKAFVFSALDASRKEHLPNVKLTASVLNDSSFDDLVRLMFVTEDPSLPMVSSLDVSVALKVPNATPPHVQMLVFKLSPPPAPPLTPVPAEASYLTPLASGEQKTEWRRGGLKATHLYALTSPDHAAKLSGGAAVVLSAIGSDSVNRRESLEARLTSVTSQTAQLELTVARTLEAVSPLEVIVALTPKDQPTQRVTVKVVKGGKANLAVMQPESGKPSIRLERTLADWLPSWPPSWPWPSTNPASLTPLIVKETNQFQAVDVKVEALSISPAGGDWYGKPRLELYRSMEHKDGTKLEKGPFTLEPGGSIELQAKLTDGDFKVGTTSGVLRLNSASLEKPLEVKYEVVTRLHKWVMFATAFLGCAFGWWVKKRLNVRRGLLAQRIPALAALQQVQDRGESYSKDAEYLKRHRDITATMDAALNDKDATGESLKKVIDAELEKQTKSEEKLEDELKTERGRLDAWNGILMRNWDLASPPAKVLLATVQEDCAAALKHLVQDPRNAGNARLKLDALNNVRVPDGLTGAQQWLTAWTAWLEKAATLPLEAVASTRSHIDQAKTAAAAPLAAGTSVSAGALGALNQMADLERRLKDIAWLLRQDLVTFAAARNWRLESAAATSKSPQWLEAAKALNKAAAELAGPVPNLIATAVQSPAQGTAALEQALLELKGKWRAALAFLPAPQQALAFPEIDLAHWDQALGHALPPAAAPPPPIDATAFMAGLGGQAGGEGSALESFSPGARVADAFTTALRALAANATQLPSADRLQTLSAKTREELNKVNTLLSVITFVLYCALLLLVFPQWSGTWMAIGTVFFSGFLADVSIKELLAVTPSLKMPSAIPPG